MKKTELAQNLKVTAKLQLSLAETTWRVQASEIVYKNISIYHSPYTDLVPIYHLLRHSFFFF